MEQQTKFWTDRQDGRIGLKGTIDKLIEEGFHIDMFIPYGHGTSLSQGLIIYSKKEENEQYTNS